MLANAERFSSCHPEEQSVIWNMSLCLLLLGRALTAPSPASFGWPVLVLQSETALQRQA